MELAISTDDVLVGSVGDRFLERGNCSLELDQPLPGPALSGERRGAFVGDGGHLPDGPAAPPDADPDKMRVRLQIPSAPSVEHTAPLSVRAVRSSRLLRCNRDFAR